MFKYFLLVCFGLLLGHQEVPGQALYPVKVSEILEHDNLKELFIDQKRLADMEAALSSIKTFLAYDDMSLIATDTATARKIKAVLRQIASPEHTLFEIVAVHSVTDKKIILAANLYLYFEKAHLQIYKGSFKIGFAIPQQKVVFPVYHVGYTTRQYKFINFHLSKSLTDAYRSNLLRADDYVSGFIEHLGVQYPAFHAPSQKLEYVISDGYFNSLEYFGIDNFFNVSHYEKADNMIIDLIAGGFYKHELLHYVFSGYPVKKFLNEGLATLFSGGNARFESDGAKEWKTIRNKIASDQQYRVGLDHTDSLFNGNYSHELYYISAILLYRYYLKLGEKAFYKQLFETLIPLDDKAAFTLLAKELGIPQLSSYLQPVGDDLWTSVKAGFGRS